MKRFSQGEIFFATLHFKLDSLCASYCCLSQGRLSLLKSCRGHFSVLFYSWKHSVFKDSQFWEESQVFLIFSL